MILHTDRRRGSPSRRFLLPFVLFAILLASPAPAQNRVPVVFKTPAFPDNNVDSCASWVPPEGSPGEPLLFVTEKDGDRIEVWLAATGAAYAPKPFIGGEPDSSEPGQFDRPNGVWVLYHVPFAGSFADVLLVTDQTNKRVQTFRLPELSYCGEFGTGQIGKGYGLSPYQDGTDYFVFITDNSPPTGFPGKIKKYRLRTEGAGLGADLVFGVGSSTGIPPLPNVESIAADLFHDRLHVCGDEGGEEIFLFRLDGTYTGTTYGDPQFENNQEGINIYDTGAGQGYLIVSDQYTNGDPNEFELFRRDNMASLGHFQSADDGIITENTDGDFLEQRGFPAFPDGAFYAVHDDQECHAYDWTDIAEEMGLEIVALDRSFPAAPALALAPARTALWRHDGSWWAVLPRGGRLAIARLEDGTFAAKEDLGDVAPASVWSDGSTLLVHAAAPEPWIRSFRYEASLRRYVPQVGPAAAPGGALSEFTVETGTDGAPARIWIAWVAGGELKAASTAADLDAFDAGASLGSSAEVLPRWVRTGASLGILWSDGTSVRFRSHADGDPAGTWSPAETAWGGAVESLAAAAGASGGVIAVAGLPSGTGRLLRRDAGGAWTELPLAGDLRDPALLADPGRGRIHLFHAAATSGTHQVLQHREADIAALAFGATGLVAGWPGVEPSRLLVSSAAPEAGPDLAAVALGDDGRGYFGRVPLPAGADLEAPYTLQHAPAPGAAGVAAGATISFRIEDTGLGVNRGTLRLLVDGTAVSLRIRGVPGNFLVEADLPAGAGPEVRIRIEASDLASPANVMTPFEYTFRMVSAGDPLFRRGDANGDGDLDVSDPVRILLRLFAGGPALTCADSGDANDDGNVDLSDPIALLEYLFEGGAALPAPGPACGVDATPDDLDCATQSGCAAR